MCSSRTSGRPRIVVLSTLFPHPGQPGAGLFIRERMFRVAEQLPLVVVAPVPWFPLQGLIRRWRPHFRPAAPLREVQQGVDVYHPRYFSVPGLFKSLDGLSMALCSYVLMRRLRKRHGFDVIDAHFAYPDGYAATWLGKWFDVPVTITLRGTEVPLSRTNRRGLILKALARASRVFSVSDSLRRHVAGLGADADKVLVVGNGVDTDKFQPVDKAQARAELGLAADAPVLVSVGGLVERKGFHRVIECLPELRQHFPGLQYLIVGGPGAEGDWSERLRQQVGELGLEKCVHFVGVVPPERLKVPLSAADVFVLATRNEGWANVFLEAMACGLPVVTTRVGGNAEVVCQDDLGLLVEFGDQAALARAMDQALRKPWDRHAIVDHARRNAWSERVGQLVPEFEALADPSRKGQTKIPIQGEMR